MKSLRGRLLLSVGLVTLSLWVVLAGVAYHLERAEMNREFDAELLHAATVFSQILEVENGDQALFERLNRPGQDASQYPGLRPLAGTHEAPLMLQILRSGELVYRSDGAPNGVLADVKNAYINVSFEGRQWRVFALSHSDFVVLVAQPLAERDKLLHLASMERAVALLAFLPLWLLCGGVVIAWSLRPVNALLRELSERDANNLTAVSSERLPSELRPIVDALNRVFRRLARALELERSFTGNAAHELRTPLAAVRTQIEVAQASDQGGRPRALAQALKGVDRLTDLLNQLLLLARLDHADQILVVENVDLGRLIRSTCESFPLFMQARFKFADAESPAWVSGNADQLQIALRNVLRNAVQHTSVDKPIEVSLHADEPDWVIHVRDYGAGVDEAQLDMLSERFYRTPGVNGAGSGLGLSIVRQVLNRHGGRLSLQSAQPGLQVFMRLPQATE